MYCLSYRYTAIWFTVELNQGMCSHVCRHTYPLLASSTKGLCPSYLHTHVSSLSTFDDNRCCIELQRVLHWLPPQIYGALDCTKGLFAMCIHNGISYYIAIHRHTLLYSSTQMIHQVSLQRDRLGLTSITWLVPSYLQHCFTYHTPVRRDELQFIITHGCCPRHLYT